MSQPSRPVYFRILGLRHIAPGRWLSLALFEGSVAAGLVLALAEFVSAWGVLVLPATVAVVVKFNDMVAGALRKPPTRATVRTIGPVGLPAVGRCRVPTPGESVRVRANPGYGERGPHPGPLSASEALGADTDHRVLGDRGRSRRVAGAGWQGSPAGRQG